MSFLNRINEGVQQNVLLQGGNSPKNKIDRNMLIKLLPPARILLNNAPAQNATAANVPNTAQTPVQRAYVSASRAIKMNAAGQRIQSWIGKSFG